MTHKLCPLAFATQPFPPLLRKETSTLRRCSSIVTCPPDISSPRVASVCNSQCCKGGSLVSIAQPLPSLARLPPISCVPRRPIEAMERGEEEKRGGGPICVLLCRRVRYAENQLLRYRLFFVISLGERALRSSSPKGPGPTLLFVHSAQFTAGEACCFRPRGGESVMGWALESRRARL